MLPVFSPAHLPDCCPHHVTLCEETTATKLLTLHKISHSKLNTRHNEQCQDKSALFERASTVLFTLKTHNWDSGIPQN